MPHLWHSITDAALFLYPTVGDAQQRTKWGGSGFLVGVPWESDSSQVHLYAVSNDHVSRPCPVIRIIKMNGQVEILAGNEASWIEHPAGDDVAIRYLGTAPVVLETARDIGIPYDGYCYFELERLIALEDFRWGEGPSVGEECLMVGRYVNHEGEQFDRSAVRFGNLSMYPESIWQPERSFHQESFLVDMRSASGFSGSAVVVYFTQPGTLSATIGDPKAPWRTLVSRYWVLGVDWGHLPVRQTIWENGKRTRITVEGSMAAVVPAWKLCELLDSDDVVKSRKQAEAVGQP